MFLKEPGRPPVISTGINHKIYLIIALLSQAQSQAMHSYLGGTVYACFIFVLGILVKQCTEYCSNCSAVTEGPRERTVSLWFMQLGLNGRVSFLFLDCFLALMVDHPGSGTS